MGVIPCAYKKPKKGVGIHCRLSFHEYYLHYSHVNGSSFLAMLLLIYSSLFEAIGAIWNCLRIPESCYCGKKFAAKITKSSKIIWICYLGFLKKPYYSVSKSNSSSYIHPMDLILSQHVYEVSLKIYRKYYSIGWNIHASRKVRFWYITPCGAPERRGAIPCAPPPHRIKPISLRKWIYFFHNSYFP